MITDFAVFQNHYRTGNIVEDASWRAYDMNAMVKPDDYKYALKHLGGVGLYDVMFAYRIPTEIMARELLGLWAIYTRINTGQMKRPKLRETDNETL